MKKTCALHCGARFKVSKVGLRAFNTVGRYVKPTTRMIQIFGPLATKSTFEIKEKDLPKLLAGEALESDFEIETGYVILSLKGGRVLGLGFLNEGKIRSQIPRKQLMQCTRGLAPASFGRLNNSRRTRNHSPSNPV